ncbi:hypothetical protein [Actinoplanes derwentensis]|uniref:VRR-NUC domain-containing protein n=1 Tax=Actinoplanes derwentensis TaxID=113562 RepID=A0A1H2CUV0_9ACTN|nr:hypothetical protein [Actinoplanes derwentensis]GID81940.1 hypothetical protein Ade03nite_08640 [Actinoplanes derwentensis]SDT74144.1 hypothetical protein SAMN04489716_6891 [Actinoplanes derwentensis]
MSRRTAASRIPGARAPRAAPPTPGPDEELEAPLQKYVRAECRERDLLHYHTARSDRSEPGFPDSVIVGPRGVLFRELKSGTGRPNADQVVWLQRLQDAGADADIWTPQDRRSGRILNELNWVARRAPAPADTVGDDLAKLLYLFENTHPAADLHWDAGSRHVDRHRWQLRADTVLRMVRAALPSTPEQAGAWMRRHGLIRPSPAQIFRALDEALTRTSPGGR